MALALKDRVFETTQTTGTGTFTLDGAVSAFQSFSVVGSGNTTPYVCVLGSSWEIGTGTVTVSGTTTLSRDTVHASSNSGNKVNWGAGVKEIRSSLPAEMLVAHPTAWLSPGNFVGAFGTTGNFNVGGVLQKASVAYPYQPASQVTTSGTSFTFSGLPSWALRVSVALDTVSLSGTDGLLIQLGTSGGIVTTGYVSSSTQMNESTNAIGGASSTSGIILHLGSAAVANLTGVVIFVRMSTNAWVCSHSLALRGGGLDVVVGGGSADIGGVLTQLRLTTTGTNTFDSGNVNILVE
jgi:hypothetical protein